MTAEKSWIGILKDFDSSCTKAIALQLRGSAGIICDVLLVLPASLFSQPVTIFAGFYPWALLLMAPSWTWFFSGAVPCTLLALTLLLLSTRFSEGSLPMRVLTLIGDSLFAVIGLLAFLLSGTGAVEICSVLFITTLFAQRVNQILKKSFARSRPPVAWPDSFKERGFWLNIRTWTVHEGGRNKGCLPQDIESFPSGDCAQAGALFATLNFLGMPPRTQLLLLPAMLAVPLGRTYFGCHWLIDSLCGLAQGILCSCVLSVCGMLRGDGRVLLNFAVGSGLYVLSGVGQRKLLARKEK